MTSTFDKTVIHSRELWGADKPKSTKPMKKQLDRIFAHWLGDAYPSHMTDAQMLLRAQNFHMNTRGWSDLAYSFAIGNETFTHRGKEYAKIYEGRGFNVAGGHTRTENDDSYGVLFLVGQGGPELTEAQWRSFTEIVELIRVNHGDNPLPAKDILVMGHMHDKEYDGRGTSTSCPGDVIAERAWAYNHARDYVPVATPPRPPAPSSPTKEEREELTEVSIDELWFVLREVADPALVEAARKRYWANLSQ